MKFSTVAIFASGALAAKPIYMEPTLVERQSASAVISDVNTISASAAALDTAIKSFSGLSDAPALISASNAVVSAINKGTTDAKASPEFTTDQITLLVPAIQALGTEVSTTVKDLIAIKSQIAALGQCGTVLTQVKAQQSAANSFQTTVIGKLPAAFQSAGQSLAAPITEALASAASAYSSCPAVTSSVAPSSSSTTAPSTSSSSSSSSSSAVTPPAYTTSSSSSAVTPPAYTTSSSAVVPPAYTSSSSVGSFTTSPSSSPSPYTNGTSPTVSTPSTPTPTIVPSNGGVQKAAGFGGLVLAAVVAVAAF